MITKPTQRGTPVLVSPAALFRNDAGVNFGTPPHPPYVAQLREATEVECYQLNGFSFHNIHRKNFCTVSNIIHRLRGRQPTPENAHSFGAIGLAIGVFLALRFRIFKVQGDGDLHFVEAFQSIDGARQRVRELGDKWAGEYAIESKGKTERVFVGTSTPKELKRARKVA